MPRRKTRRKSRRKPVKRRKTKRRSRRKTKRRSRRKTKRRSRRKTKRGGRKTRKRSKKRRTSKKRSYFKRGTPLNDKQRKYCRCIFHVSGQQAPECLRGKDWGGKCYNPYAVCTASTGRKGSFECFKYIDLDDIPKKELKAMAALKGTTIKGLREKQKKMKSKSKKK